MTPLTREEIRKMQAVCRLAADTLVHVEKFVRAGVTTNELDQIVYDFTLSHNAVPSPLNYHGYPKSVCTSVNHCICHGVPDETSLKDGDIINIDVTCFKDGFHGDTSATFFVGAVSERARKLTEAAEQAMYRGIEVVGPGMATGDIGFAVNKFVTKSGFYVVKEIGGHGIGKKFHDEPFVPSYGKKGRGPRLVPWICLTVEPMVNETGGEIQEFDIPNSTVKYYETGDGSLSAQFEHTILVTDQGCEILTAR